LQQQYVHKLGVYTIGSQEESKLLLAFWKDKVSAHYAIKREQQKRELADK